MRDSVRKRIGRLEIRGKNIALEDCPMCRDKALIVIVEDSDVRNYDFNATNRLDSITYICSDCGNAQALAGIERVYE